MPVRFNVIIPAVFLAILAVACTDSEPPAPDDGDNTIVLDTTSHDFVWDITQIGIRHTMLFDIEAISDTDVWICGEIHFENTYRYDSLGNYIKPFNLAHWDGREWTFIRLQWPDDLPLEVDPVSAIKAFSCNDIWFHTGRKIAHMKNGENSFWELPYEKGGTRLMEGMPNDLYFAGSGGKLMHFDGTEFRMLNSGTDKDIQDMWSVGKTVLCVADNWSEHSNNETLVLKLENGGVSQWRDTAMYKGMCGIWAPDMRNIFFAGPGVLQYNPDNVGVYRAKSGWITHQLPFNGFLMKIRGTALNDIFVGGHFGAIQHFNGYTWRYYQEAAPYEREYVLRLLCYIPNHVFFVGDDKAGVSYVIHGKRR